ncbi:TAT-variant-translocated molybdopterin oxidoreductase [Gemmata sp. JC717]|uniref:TAT-variant-translocated molybdopterin oxidoreductase n=1 Tax=Gemmata algarum TaxID=2975278 RepID=UPI0021BAD04C|nr:TAT-variant-translocated molybdopterin oxidoreductase [Gemmata algarum]MDY3556558.1 TAT-variant-translocated molybdopterin oxidoreductase [Gemmata algarum]
MKPDSTETSAGRPAAPTMWRGLDELAASPEFLAAAMNEFPEGATELADEPSRRRFMALMGASVALATGAGCNLRPAAQRKILPYTTQPDELTPGLPLYFASAAPLGGYGQGVLVRSNEGRPTKVEGNPEHPSSLGGASIHALASVLDLYDPDRSRGVTRRGAPAGYDEALAAVREKLYPNGTANAGLRLRILTETVTSPTLGRLLTSLLNTFPAARWVQYDAIGSENAKAGSVKAFGTPNSTALAATYDFVKADVVLSLDCDFLSDGPGHVRYSRDFADRRKVRQDGKSLKDTAAGKRTPEGVQPDALNRLYVVESMPTNAGAVADHRLPLKASQLEAFARELAKELGLGAPAGALPADAKLAKDWIKPLAADLKAKAGKSVVLVGEHAPASVHALVFAINQHLGNIGQTVKLAPTPAVTVAGKMSDLKTLTKELADKAFDALIVIGDVNPAHTAPADIEFAAALKAAGEDAAKLTLHLGQRQDETGVLCQWHINEAHYLEAWGDIRGHDGTAAIQQPLIAPLHGGKSAIEFFGALVPSPSDGDAKLGARVSAATQDPYEVVRATWRAWYDEKNKGAAPGGFEIFWQQAVRSGVVAGSAPAPVTAALAANWAAGAAAPAAPAGDFELNIRACPSLHDGRFANNGWLQELPKPLTKISWDNAAFLSPKTADKLGVSTSFRWTAGEHGRAEVNVVEIEVGGKKIKAPVWVLPGHVDDSVTIHLGHGRDGARAGSVAGVYTDAAIMGWGKEVNVDGKPVAGFDAYPVRTSGALWTAAAKVTKTAATYLLACTQGHWSMAEKDPVSGKVLDRKPVRKGTVEEYKKNKAFAKIPPMAAGETEEINLNLPLPKAKDPAQDPVKTHHPHDGRLHPLNMYKPAEGLAPDLKDAQRRRWGMAIDLSACTGCSACVVACVSENNIPVVGKNQVTKGREMHWIRIDRYYETTSTPDMKDASAKDAAAIRTYFQPVMCVQCENAPCEIVCPVGATVHSSDGLNDMAYNRCVGTRYCSNNCPYKVRRFNFLTFQDWATDTLKLGRNPDVSVRSRGVMEKCTFCVQRIRGAEIVAEREFRQIRDGEILTACQSACPSGAIVFGDLNDADSAVSKWKNEPANYGLLAEINTRPRLTHMAAIRNPNPAMPKGN